jgi:hypothetical protein
MVNETKVVIMKKVVAVVFLLVGFLLSCLTIFLLGVLAFALLVSVVAMMSPDSDGTQLVGWGQVVWFVERSFLALFSALLSIVVGMLLWRSARKK